LDDILWSIFSIFTGRLFYSAPSVSKVDGRLIAKTKLKGQILGLGCSSRRVEVDPNAKIVRIVVRRFWFARSSRRIEFDWIEEVLYDYQDLAASGYFSHREQDMFTVSLQLKNGETVLLFRFYGQGAFENNSIMPDWYYWQQNLETRVVAGNQESESQAYADVVGRLIGVPVGNSTP
jgi:hypothetical protein